MAIPECKVFFVSDSTAITIEKLGQSLLSQFPEVDFQTISLRYINSTSKAKQACEEIQKAVNEKIPVIVFSSLADPLLRKEIQNTNIIILDIFDTFLTQLETVFAKPARSQVGQAHGISNNISYQQRMEAVNFSLRCDDGLAESSYADADVILLGVSRCGKTPTCLYLAMQYGIYAANYPLTEESGLSGSLPAALCSHRHKLVGLSIEPRRLQQIRAQRRSSTDYASLEVCKREVRRAETLYAETGIVLLDSSQMSVEEIATHVLSLIS